MPTYEGVPRGGYDAGVVPNDVFGIAINYFVNRAPLLCRLPKLPTGSPHFQLQNDSYRPRWITMDNGGPLVATGRRAKVSDASILASGDVIQVEQEHMRVFGVIAEENVVLLHRGYAGTTAAAHDDGLPVYLVSTAEPKADVSPIPQATMQYCETFQGGYKLGQLAAAESDPDVPPRPPLDPYRMSAVQDVVRRFETACYYGTGISATPSVAPRPSMKGVQSILTTNNVHKPINAHAYKPSDFVRDTLQACFNGGGNPNLLVVSTDFLAAFAVWGHAAMRVDAGSNVFGVPIDLFEAPFLAGISIIPAPLLRPGTAICLSAHEAGIRLKRPLVDVPRPSREGTTEGDMIMEGAVELDNEAHHAMVSGVTAYSAT